MDEDPHRQHASLENRRWNCTELLTGVIKRPHHERQVVNLQMATLKRFEEFIIALQRAARNLMSDAIILPHLSLLSLHTPPPGLSV